MKKTLSFLRIIDSLEYINIDKILFKKYFYIYHILKNNKYRLIIINKNEILIYVLLLILNIYVF
jgi:hypothetical protein